MKRLNTINTELDLEKYTPITRSGLYVSELERTENGWKGVTLITEEPVELWDANGNALSGQKKDDIFLVRNIPRSMFIVMDDQECKPIPVKGKTIFYSIAEIEKATGVDAEELNIVRVHIY